MRQSVILYDDQCGFCRWALSKILRWDRSHNLRPVALQSPEAEFLLRDMDPVKRAESWHLVAPDGRIHSAGAGAVPLFNVLPYARPLAWLAQHLPGTTNWIYRSVATHRGWLGAKLGSQACAVPPRLESRDSSA